MKNFVRQWRIDYNSRKKYSKWDRIPFFDAAGYYLPKNNKSTIVDIGAGNGSFADHLSLKKRFKNVFLLDGNKDSIKTLHNKGYNNSIIYTAPSEMPFNSNSVNYVHTSHMIEHLNPDELHSFLKEIDRVLSNNGTIVISAPMLWPNFYDDLTHIRPYHPESIIHYLCSSPENRTKEDINGNYEIVDIIYRYSKIDDYQTGSEIIILDLVIKILHKLRELLRIYRYKKNGYTIVFRKIKPKRV